MTAKASPDYATKRREVYEALVSAARGQGPQAVQATIILQEGKTAEFIDRYLARQAQLGGPEDGAAVPSNGTSQT